MTNIIIPIKGRPRLAKQTIESLYENTPNDMFSLYLFLDAVDEETRTTIKKYGTKADIVCSNYESQGPGWCRNRICDMLVSSRRNKDFLYHSDSDVYFKEGWLEALIKAYETFPEVKLFGAGCHPYLETNQVLEKDGVTVHTKDAIPGFTAFMDWDTWNKYGPYDEHKDIMGSEDWKFCRDIIKDGYKVASLYPELVVHTGKTNSRGELATGHERMVAQEGIIIE